MKSLTARFVLPITGPVVENGAVVIDDERIVDIGPRDQVLPRYPEALPEDFPHAVLMPGLVNAHTHLDLLNFSGSGETPQFFDWLVAGWDHRKKMTPAERRHCLEDGIRQLLRCGITSVGDAGQYAGVIPQVINSPIRMVLFPELLSGGEDGIMEGYEGAMSQIDEILGSGSRKIGAGIAPYAAYTLSRHLLKIVSQQARSLRIPVKIHVSETFAEMQFFYESSGEIAEKLFPRMGWADQLPPEHRKTPIQYLESIGFLEAGPTLVGCNHLGENDLQAIARSGAKVVHSPRASAHLKLGSPPLRKLRDLRIPVALGTDGTGSLHSLSIWDEMRYIRNHYPETEQPSPEELLAMATMEGARALGLADRIGSIEAGKEADIIAVRIHRDLSADQLLPRLIDNTTEREIAAVFIEGQRVH